MNRLVRSLLAAATLVGALAVAGVAGRRDRQTVYTLSNSPAGNAVLAFTHANGALTPAGSFPTGGNGTGAGLGSQGRSSSARTASLFAVDAASNTISMFAVKHDGSLECRRRRPAARRRSASPSSKKGALTLLSPPTTIGAGSHPLDEAVSRNGDWLYDLVDGFHQLQAFRVNGNGSLTWNATIPGLPAGAMGLAAG